MRRLIVLSLLALVAVASILSQADADHYHKAGDGSPRGSRFPWLDGEVRPITTGWFGGSHGYPGPDQYATDWGGVFEVYAASEGDAKCYRNAGEAGNFIELTRNGGKSEKYLRR